MQTSEQDLLGKATAPGYPRSQWADVHVPEDQDADAAETLRIWCALMPTSDNVAGDLAVQQGRDWCAP